MADEVGIRVTRSAVDVVQRVGAAVVARPVLALFPHLLRANWNQPVEVETAWLTDINEDEAGTVEERIALRERPIRTITASLFARDGGPWGERIPNLEMALSRFSFLPSPVSLWSDKTKLDAACTGTTATCDTRWRRFYPGQRVAFAAPDYSEVEASSGDRFDHVTQLITEVYPDHLILADVLDPAMPSGSWVYPMIDAELATDSTVTLGSDTAGTARISFTESGGSSALPGSWGEDVSGYFLTAEDGLPIFDVRPSWRNQVTYAIVRPSRLINSGRQNSIVGRGELPLRRFGLNYDALNRRDAWRLLRFFDSRMGRYLPFHLVNPQTSFRVLSQAASLLEVEADFPSTDVSDFMTHIALVLRDGTTVVRGIQSVALQTSPRLLQLVPTTAFPDPLPAPIVRATTSHFVRFDSDSMTQTWFSDEACMTALAFQELLPEKSLAITDL